MGSFWRLVGASRLQFPPALVPFVIVFGWGVVVGQVSKFEQKSWIEIRLEEVDRATKQLSEEWAHERKHLTQNRRS